MTIGIFDSGEGGANLLYHARKRNGSDDFIFLCDRGRAPYGTKRDFELSGIVNDNIANLKRMGAERVIIACCTACTVFDTVEDTAGVFPILYKTAKRAERISDGRIAVIATGRTVASHAFSRSIKKRDVIEIEAQPLVGIIDGGENDLCHSSATRRTVTSILSGARGADTLVLGCTHFSSLYRMISEIAKEMGIDHVVDAARVGAELVPKTVGSGGVDYIFKTNEGGKPI